jgi:hypothetical protein
MSDMSTTRKLDAIPSAIEGPDYDLLAQIDYVIGSVEKSLDRLSAARSLSPANNLLIAFSIAGSGFAFMLEASARSLWSILLSPPGIVMTLVVYVLLALYLLATFARRREVMRRANIVRHQLDYAEETLRNLKSWVDRSEMPYRLRKAMDLRSAYLDALVAEAHASVDAGIWLLN